MFSTAQLHFPTQAQNKRNCFLAVPKIWFASTFTTLKRTVFASGRHCPAVTMSPSFTSKQGEQCTETFLWRFSKRLYFFDVMQVVAPDNDSPLHLCGDAHAFQDLSSDAHIPCERAFLVHIFPVLGLFRSREAKAHISPIPIRALGFLPQQPLRADEDVVLLLEGFFSLIHVC